MVLCNLAYLTEKSRRFGFSSALRELKEAQVGLAFERKKFLDFESWQDMYCAWSDQVLNKQPAPLDLRTILVRSWQDIFRSAWAPGPSRCIGSPTHHQH